jgi:hypothetical protein
MSILMDLAAKNFAPRPLADHAPGRPPPEPAPEKELTAAQVVHRGGEPAPWPSPDDLPEVKAARQQLRDAEAALERLRRDIDAARAAAATKAPDAADLARYLKDGRAPGRDKDAQAAGERARALEALVGPAKEAVEAARAAGRAAWDAAPAALWAAAEPEWRAAVTAVAATLAQAVRAQLVLRALSERYAEFLRRHRLPEGEAVPGFYHRGLRLEPQLFDALLHERSPRANNELIKFLEDLRRAGALDYAAFDLRPLDLARATDAALLRLDDVMKEVAGQLRPEPEPEPEKKGA